MTVVAIDEFRTKEASDETFDVYLNISIIREKEFDDSKIMMDIITRMAKILKEKLEKKYGNRFHISPHIPMGKRRIYADLDYHLEELGRGKIYIGTYPENTYSLEEYLKSPEEYQKKYHDKDMIDVFFDVGSPIRHIYIVKKRGAHSYEIDGMGMGCTHHYYIYVDIFSYDSLAGTFFPREQYEDKIDSNDIFIMTVYPENIATDIRKYILEVIEHPKSEKNE